MKRLVSFFALILCLTLLTACGDDKSATMDKSEATDKTAETAQADAAMAPFTADEFEKFVGDIPSIPGMTLQSQMAMAKEDLNPETMSNKMLEGAKKLGWDEERFMYVYTHAMSVMSLEQMTQMIEQMEKEMEALPESQKEKMGQLMDNQMSAQVQAIQAEVEAEVPASEQEIVRANLDKLTTALGINPQ